MGIKGFSSLLRKLNIGSTYDNLHECLSTVYPPIKAIAIDGNLYANKYAISIGDISVGFIRQVNFFLSHGIIPIYVFDGRESYPVEKKQTQVRRAIKNKVKLQHGIIEEIQKLLLSAGIPTIASPCEADCLCALLSSQGIVDACLSDDMDVVVYGGRIIKKVEGSQKVVVYNYTDVICKLGFTCKEALYSFVACFGCDYGRGLKAISSNSYVDALQFYQLCSGDLDTFFDKMHATVQDIQRIKRSVEVMKENHNKTSEWFLGAHNTIFEALQQEFHMFEEISSTCRHNPDLFPLLPSVPYNVVKSIKWNRSLCISDWKRDRC